MLKIKDLETRIKKLMKNEDRRDVEMRFVIAASELGDLAKYISHDQVLNPNARPHGTKEDEVLAYGQALVQVVALAYLRGISAGQAFKKGLQNWEEADWRKVVAQGEGVEGLIACPGVVRGQAYVAMSSKDFDRDEETLIQFRRALEFLKSRVEGIVIAGDLSHTNYPSISTNTYVSKVLHLLDRVELPSLVFSGNHDYTHEGKHILQPFKANDWNNLMIVDRPCLWENMCIVPHIPRKFLGDVRSKEELSQKINEYYSEALRTFPSKILVTHAQLAGCSVSSGYVFETGTVELNSINSTVHLEMIIAGDIHKGQSYCGGGSVSIVYPGSLTQTDYGERNDVKGVAIVDTESFSAELFEIPGYTKYLHFDLEALKDIDAITTEQWNGILNFSRLDPSKRELYLQKINEKYPKSI